MAHGDPIDSGRVSGNSYFRSFRLLDGATATSNGQWVDARGFRRMSVHVSGFGTATVQIRGSNAATQPDNGSHGAQLGSDVTSESIVDVDLPVRWIKARVSAYTSGTIDANLNAVET